MGRNAGRRTDLVQVEAQLADFRFGLNSELGNTEAMEQQHVAFFTIVSLRRRIRCAIVRQPPAVLLSFEANDMFVHEVFGMAAEVDKGRR